MIEIQSYLFIDEKFIPVELAEQLADEKDILGLGNIIYLQGALELKIDTYSFFDQTNSFDYIVWLWDLIVASVTKLVEGHDDVFSLPDQPVDCAFTHLGDGQLKLTLTPATTGRMSRSVVVRKSEFTRAVILAGLKFYIALDKICPKGMTAYADSKAKLLALTAKMA